MENDIFKAGVVPGSPTSHNEIKMLVLYMLLKVGADMNFAQIHEALLENGLVNYFELVQVVDGLLKTGHLEKTNTEKGERYTITPTGEQAAEVFAQSLPLSVREKAMHSATLVLKRSQRETEVQIDIKSCGGGYQVEFAIPAESSKLISFSVFAPTKEECNRMKRQFLNDPLFIYKGVVALLTGDQDVLGEIFPQQEQLF